MSQARIDVSECRRGRTGAALPRITARWGDDDSGAIFGRAATVIPVESMGDQNWLLTSAFEGALAGLLVVGVALVCVWFVRRRRQAGDNDQG